MTAPSSMPSTPESIPEPAALRAELACLSNAGRKIVGGLVVVMMREPERVKEREWLLESYTVLAAKALELGEEQTEQLRDFVRGERDSVLNATMGLFLRVAHDMAGLGGAWTLGQATMVALSYFESPDE